VKTRRATRAPGHRLPPDVTPEEVRVQVDVDPSRGPGFRGRVALDLRLARRRSWLELHAAELRVTRPRIRVNGRSGPVLVGRVEALPEHERIRVHVDRPLPPGMLTLELDFRGRLRKDLCGLYAAKVGSRRYAFTQLEATDARKFFPCLDEPAMKARFCLSVTTGARNQVISNAPAERTERLPDRRKTVHFEPTPPLSSYLVALAVGELEASRPVSVGPTAIRVWHAPGKGALSGFALEAARECLRRLEHYFGVPYPYAKLDLVAVPDFEFGAMENAGAVFFRETLLLLDPARATLTERKRAAEVICHELAHMWYGDLVTMQWWDDLWLNESFATWMAFQIVDDWKPEWKMWHDFQHGRAAALELDALRNTHPIYCRVRTPAEASENFDLITYEKGASVVRMLERYLGAPAFRRGVRAYIREHREGNAVAADLWRALSRASGEDVERVARAWIETPGHPVVEVRRKGRRLELRQQRLFLRPPSRRPASRWPVPWVGRVGRGRRSRTERRLLTRARETFTLPGRAPEFVYGNADEGGFFRPLHVGDDLRALIGRFASLRAVERMGLVDHQWALVCARRAPLDSLLELADGLVDERDPDVLVALLRPLRFIGDGLVPDAAPSHREAYGAWLRDRFGPGFRELGWDPERGEPDDRRLRRAALLALVGGIGGDPELIREAGRRCDRYLDDRLSLDANLADPVVALGARDGGAARHERFRRAAVASQTPQEQRRFLLALADFREPGLVQRSLDLALTDTVATQDLVLLLVRLMANPAARQRTWAFVKRRWGRLHRRMPSLMASRLIEATAALRTPAYRRDVARFFRAHRVPSGERALRQALERFDWYRGFRRGAARELGAWLDARGGGG
jgi:puromycin-sensitive aminopeptidase